ncbi:hypothetical protein D3C72_2159630 [compost metagenome]
MPPGYRTPSAMRFTIELVAALPNLLPTPLDSPLAFRSIATKEEPEIFSTIFVIVPKNTNPSVETPTVPRRLLFSTDRRSGDVKDKTPYNPNKNTT